MLVPELRIRGVPSKVFFLLFSRPADLQKRHWKGLVAWLGAPGATMLKFVLKRCRWKWIASQILLIMILSVFSTFIFYYGHCDLVWLTFNSIVMFGEMRAFMKTFMLQLFADGDLWPGMRRTRLFVGPTVGALVPL